MFSNLIGQENSVDILRKEITNDTIANSMIFYGPKYSGKLTAALETARALNCKFDRLQNCNCDSCVKFYSLDHNSVLLLSRRNYYYETIQLIESYRKNKTEKIRNIIYKNIKLTFMPLQDFLLKDAMVDADRKSVIKFGEKISDIIDNDEYSSVELDEIEKMFEFFKTFYKTQNIPVNVIRNMLDWTYITKSGSKKVVIIDGVDQLESSSENILLKRLEEPSDGLYFILIANNKSRIIQTIKSRCRVYQFNELSEESIRYIVKNNYDVDAIEAGTLYNFFHTKDPTSLNNIKQKLVKLINLIFDKNQIFSDLYLFLEAEKNKDIQMALLKEMRNAIEKEILNREYSIKEAVMGEYPVLRHIQYDSLKYISEELLKVHDRTNIYNLTVRNQLEGIFFPLKEMVQNDKI